MRKVLGAALAAVAMMAAGAVPAAADDAALKKAMNGPACATIVRELRRLERAFERIRLDGLSLPEIRHALGTPDRVAQALEGRLQHCAGVLERRQPSSVDGERAQQLAVDGLLTAKDGTGAFRRALDLLSAMTHARSRGELQRRQQRMLAALREFRRLWLLAARDLRAADRLLRRL